MRIIYKVLLGLIIFNVMLVVFANFFPGEETVTGTDTTTTLAGYKNFSTASMISNAILTGGGVFAAVVVGSFLLKGSIPTGQFIGAGSIIALIAGLWAVTSAPILSIVNSYGGAYGMIFYDVLVICIGIITVFGIAEIFTGRGDVESG